MRPSGIAGFWKDTSGVTAIEYGLLALFVAVGIVASVTVLGENLSASYENTGESFPDR